MKYDGVEIRECQPDERTKGHFFIDGAPRCQCGRVEAPKAPTVIDPMADRAEEISAMVAMDLERGEVQR